MALKPTIYKIQVQLADSDRSVYDTLPLVLAQHPSETLERLAARLLAYSLNVEPGLEFTKGLSSTDEPDLWQISDSGEVLHWIEVGQPEASRLRKACGRSPLVSVYSFGRSSGTWWKQQESELSQLRNTSVWQMDWSQIESVSQLLRRTCTLGINIVGGMVYVDSGGESVEVSVAPLLDNHSR